jgi:hypothetical protein
MNIGDQIIALIECFYQLYKLNQNNLLALFSNGNLEKAVDNLKASVHLLEKKLLANPHN